MNKYKTLFHRSLLCIVTLVVLLASCNKEKPNNDKVSLKPEYEALFMSINMYHIPDLKLIEAPAIKPSDSTEITWDNLSKIQNKHTSDQASQDAIVRYSRNMINIITQPSSYATYCQCTAPIEIPAYSSKEFKMSEYASEADNDKQAGSGEESKIAKLIKAKKQYHEDLLKLFLENYTVYILNDDQHIDKAVSVVARKAQQQAQEADKNAPEEEELFPNDMSLCTTEDVKIAPKQSLPLNSSKYFYFTNNSTSINFDVKFHGAQDDLIDANNTVLKEIATIVVAKGGYIVGYKENIKDINSQQQP